MGRVRERERDGESEREKDGESERERDGESERERERGRERFSHSESSFFMSLAHISISHRKTSMENPPALL